jgi:serine/threonine protein kinase
LGVAVVAEPSGEQREQEPAPKSSWELDPGAEIAPGRSVVKGVGGGTRYEVFLVWDDDLHALAVAKVIRPDQAEAERPLRELGEEADLLGRLAHPVIVRGFDTVLEGPMPHLVIEHLEGPSLRRLLRMGGPLELQQLLPLAMHVAGALVYMERQGFVHLDVKPDNIIMGVPPRLIDLSIARSLDRAARTRGVIGTDAYLSPEQCGTDELQGRMGPPADVWGLGATLHHCLSGSKPFPRERGARASEDPLVRFPQLSRAAIALPSSVPAELAELIVAMMSVEPGDRPTAAGVTERLEPLVVDLPHKLSFSRRGYRAR